MPKPARPPCPVLAPCAALLAALLAACAAPDRRPSSLADAAASGIAGPDRLSAYRRVDAEANRLLRSPVSRVVARREVRAEGVPLVLELLDRSGDGRPDEFAYVTPGGAGTPDFGFLFDLDGDGRPEHVVFNGGPLLARGLQKMVWMNYHWIDSDGDGRTDVVVFNDVDLDGDGFPDEGLTAWIHDRDRDGLPDAGEYLGDGVRRAVEERDGHLVVKRATGERRIGMRDPEELSVIDEGLADVRAALADARAGAGESR